LWFARKTVKLELQHQKLEIAVSVMDNNRVSQAGTASASSCPLPLKQIVLASGSPRRAEILRKVGWSFEALPVDLDETPVPGEDPVAYVERLAREKAEAAASRVPDRVVLGCDTTVVIDDQKLGKPLDNDDARRMIRMLSGRWHEVLTGVALISPGIRAGDPAIRRVTHESTRVRFAELSDDEIDWYVATGEPMDKAGAYAIQGCAAFFIEAIEGDYFNIVGLPVRLVYKLMKEISG
jgi:septum formation protein